SAADTKTATRPWPRRRCGADSRPSRGTGASTGSVAPASHPPVVGEARLLFLDARPDLFQRLACGKGAGLVPLVPLHFALVRLALSLDGLKVGTKPVLRRTFHDPVLELVRAAARPGHLTVLVVRRPHVVGGGDMLNRRGPRRARGLDPTV